VNRRLLARRHALVWLPLVTLAVGCARHVSSTALLKTTEGSVAFTNERNGVRLDVAQGNSAQVTLTEKRTLDVDVPADNASPLRMRVRDRFAAVSPGSSFTASATKKQTAVAVKQGSLVVRGRGGCEKIGPGSQKAVEAAAGEAAATIEEIHLPAVHYGFKSARPLAADAPVIDCVADLLGDYPDARLVLEGHADEVGSREYNLRLSKRRAEAVRRALIADGIRASRLDARGLGRSRPVASNKTGEGRARNRRVEFKPVSR